MVSNDGSSKGGKYLHYNTGSNGSTCTVRVGSRNLPLYPLVIMGLGLLNTILMLTAIVIGIYCGKVSEESAPFQITATALQIEVKQLQVMLTEVIKAQEEVQQAQEKVVRSHQQLNLQIKQNKALSDSFQRQIETLQVEKAMLQTHTSDMLSNCGRCQHGWFLLNTSCYFHSKSASNSLKNWTDSRADCLRRGADLAVIENLEEQLNLFEYLPKMNAKFRVWSNKAGSMWIGLTDIQAESNWLWINNVTLQGEGYWTQGQPDNYGDGEDCAALINIDNPRETWFDANCNANKEWLCEKQPN